MVVIWVVPSNTTVNVNCIAACCKLLRQLLHFNGHYYYYWGGWVLNAGLLCSRSNIMPIEWHPAFTKNYMPCRE